LTGSPARPSPCAAAGALKQPVTDAVRSRLDGLDMNHPPHLKVRVTAGSR